MSTKTTYLTVTGMHCPSCAMLIEMMLKKEPGIEATKADYVKGTTEVTYDPDTISIDGITAKIAELDYSAVEAS